MPEGNILLDQKLKKFLGTTLEACYFDNPFQGDGEEFKDLIQRIEKELKNKQKFEKMHDYLYSYLRQTGEDTVEKALIKLFKTQNFFDDAVRENPEIKRFAEEICKWTKKENKVMDPSIIGDHISEQKVKTNLEHIIKQEDVLDKACDRVEKHTAKVNPSVDRLDKSEGKDWILDIGHGTTTLVAFFIAVLCGMYIKTHSS